MPQLSVVVAWWVQRPRRLEHCLPAKLTIDFRRCHCPDVSVETCTTSSHHTFSSAFITHSVLCWLSSTLPVKAAGFHSINLLRRNVSLWERCQCRLFLFSPTGNWKTGGPSVSMFHRLQFSPAYRSACAITYLFAWCFYCIILQNHFQLIFYNYLRATANSSGCDKSNKIFFLLRICTHCTAPGTSAPLECM